MNTLWGLDLWDGCNSWVVISVAKANGAFVLAAKIVVKQP